MFTLLSDYAQCALRHCAMVSACLLNVGTRVFVLAGCLNLFELALVG